MDAHTISAIYRLVAAGGSDGHTGSKSGGCRIHGTGKRATGRICGRVWCGGSFHHLGAVIVIWRRGFTIFPEALIALKLAGGLYLLFIGARSLLGSCQRIGW
jgi:hypothetical protein